MSSSHETFVKENRSFWGEGDVVELVPTVFWVKGKKKKKIAMNLGYIMRLPRKILRLTRKKKNNKTKQNKTNENSDDFAG